VYGLKESLWGIEGENRVFVKRMLLFLLVFGCWFWAVFGLFLVLVLLLLLLCFAAAAGFMLQQKGKRGREFGKFG